MKFNISSRRREIVFVFLSVIVLAFLIGLLSNIVFSEFYTKNKFYFILIIIIAFFLTFILLFLKVLYSSEQNDLSFEFVLTLNRKTRKFVDIFNCASTVHGRYVFDCLSEIEQSKIVEYIPIKVPFKEVKSFFENVAQELVLSSLTNVCLSCDTSIVNNYDDLPSGIKRNPYFKKNMKDVGIKIPPGFIIETYGAADNYLRLKSKFGLLEFEWTCFTFNERLTDPIIILMKNGHVDDYNDWLIEVTFKYKINMLRVFSKDINTFIMLIENINTQLKKFDWTNIEKRVPLMILKEISDKL